jgi:hypothetical protein
LVWAAILAVIIGLFFAVKYLRIYLARKKQIRLEGGDIPKEVMEDFILAEKNFKEARGKVSPHTVLFEIAKSKLKGGNEINGNESETGEQRGIDRRAEDNPWIIPGEPTAPETTGTGEPQGGQDIPNGETSSDDVDNGSDKQSDKKDKRAYFADLIRRKQKGE